MYRAGLRTTDVNTLIRLYNNNNNNITPYHILLLSLLSLELADSFGADVWQSASVSSRDPAIKVRVVCVCVCAVQRPWTPADIFSRDGVGLLVRRTNRPLIELYRTRRLENLLKVAWSEHGIVMRDESVLRRNALRRRTKKRSRRPRNSLTSTRYRENIRRGCDQPPFRDPHRGKKKNEMIYDTIIVWISLISKQW